MPAPQLSKAKCDDDECDASVTSSNRRYVLTFLTFGSAFSIAMYYIFSISERQDIPLIWAFMICAVTIGYLTNPLSLFDISFTIQDMESQWCAAK